MKDLMYALMELKETQDAKDAKEAERIAAIYLRDSRINIDLYEKIIRHIRELIDIEGNYNG